MFISSNTFFWWGGGSHQRTPNGSLTCDFVSSPGRPQKQVVYNFKLLRVPWVFENNIHKVNRCLPELDFDYIAWFQQSKLTFGKFVNKLRQVYSLWRRRVQSQKMGTVGSWYSRIPNRGPKEIKTMMVIDWMETLESDRRDSGSSFNVYYMRDFEQTQV